MSDIDEIEKQFALEVVQIPADPGGWQWRIVNRRDGATARDGAMAHETETEARDAGQEALRKHARYVLLGSVDDWT